jgi:16S rRNA (uracil1498-N3)-methyltransferase
MSNRVYINCPLEPGPVTIQGPEAHHLAVVCRARPGDVVCLFNGNGREYPATVQEVGKRGVTVQVHGVERPARELGYRLEVAAPLPKGDRGQFLLEKLTELGATAYIPLHTRRSVIAPGAGRLDKLERYVIEASKQTGRNVLMRVEAAQDWATYCGRPDLPATRLLATLGGTVGRVAAGQDLAVAVGPEGGFTEDEEEAGRRAGWQVVGLGPRILRIETAAIVLAVLGAGLHVGG